MMWAFPWTSLSGQELKKWTNSWWDENVLLRICHSQIIINCIEEYSDTDTDDPKTNTLLQKLMEYFLNELPGDMLLFECLLLIFVCLFVVFFGYFCFLVSFVCLFVCCVCHNHVFVSLLVRGQWYMAVTICVLQQLLQHHFIFIETMKRKVVVTKIRKRQYGQSRLFEIVVKHPHTKMSVDVARFICIICLVGIVWILCFVKIVWIVKIFSFIFFKLPVLFVLPVSSMNLLTVMGCATVFGQTCFPFLSICIRLHHCLSQSLFYFLPQLDRTMSQPCWLAYICL